MHDFTGAGIEGINIAIIGGHAGSTIPPLFSQDTAAVTMALDKIPDVDKKVQDAGTAVGRCSPDNEGSAHADEAICVQAERSSNRAVAKRSRFRPSGQTTERSDGQVPTPAASCANERFDSTWHGALERLVAERPQELAKEGVSKSPCHSVARHSHAQKPRMCACAAAVFLSAPPPPRPANPRCHCVDRGSPARGSAQSLTA